MFEVERVLLEFLKGCDVSALLVDCEAVGVEFSVLVTSTF